jgi:hypothetical protein
LNGLGIGAEGRRTLGRVQSGDAATGSGSHINQAAIFAQSCSDEIDRARDLG